MNPSRRAFLAHAGATGIGLLTFTVAGCEREMTPAGARQAQVPFKVLTAGEGAVLEALGEVLVPGSAEAGLAHYIDHQLGTAPADSMLMIRYLDPQPPYLPFYRSGLAATEALARASFGQAFADLPGESATKLVTRIASDAVSGWQGPPAGFFYFVLRNDAIDVVYGTRDGFAALGIPYMAHIEPPSRWGE